MSEVIITSLVERADAESNIRPVDTKSFKKYYSEKSFEFPDQYIHGVNKVWTSDPQSSRVLIQNTLLVERHFNK